MMKKQLKIMGAFVERQGHSDSLTWLKLLFQQTLDSEISKMLDFYKFKAQALRVIVDDLENKDKYLLRSILNVRRPRTCSCKQPVGPQAHALATFFPNMHGSI